jgi:rhamnan synthesis protein F
MPKTSLLTGMGSTQTAEVMSLSNVDFSAPGVTRLWHGLGLHGRIRFLRRVLLICCSVVAGMAVDLAESVTGHRKRHILRTEPGMRPRPDARRVALYAHYCASGRVSGMVMQQLRAYAAAGFAVVFATASPVIVDEDWAEVASVATLLVHRRNHGLDFGAWRDLADSLRERWPNIEELLLVNDSVLGPIRPLEPVFAALRAGGDGLFGLTDSLQGGGHLQSYFLLGRGRDAVAEMLAFMRSAPISASKWLMVQRCEMGLSRHMHRKGFRIAALFGYKRLLAAINAHLPEGLAHLAPDSRDQMGGFRSLPKRPLNPVHHLWRPLVCLLGFPFVKTELVRRNPGRLPHIGSWMSLVGPESPTPTTVLASHLVEIGP